MSEPRQPGPARDPGAGGPVGPGSTESQPAGPHSAPPETPAPDATHPEPAGPYSAPPEPPAPDATQPEPTPGWTQAEPAGASSTHPEPPAPPRRGLVVPALVAALVASLVTLSIAVPTTIALQNAAAPDEPAPAEPAAAPPETDATIADIAEMLLPAVARVDVATARGEGSGSAVVYRADGYLLTNAHVIGGADEVEVTLPDGSTLAAEVVGADEFNDLAVLRVDIGQVPAGELPLPSYATELPRVGETAIAIGSPFELDGSVTAGIISGLGRDIPGTQLRDLVQTDAPINPGNSGGALANDRGEVIGINTAILGEPGTRGNIGIGFAIPMTTAAPIADDLIEHGFVRHAQLGVQAQDIDPRVAEAYGLGVREGAVVVTVAPGTAAEDAGLARGDIITAVGDEEISGTLDLVAVIRQHDPGDEVDVTFVRAGEEQTVTVTLGEADSGL